MKPSAMLLAACTGSMWSLAHAAEDPDEDCAPGRCPGDSAFGCARVCEPTRHAAEHLRERRQVECIAAGVSFPAVRLFESALTIEGEDGASEAHGRLVM